MCIAKPCIQQVQQQQRTLCVLIRLFYREMCIAKPCIQQVQQQQRTLRVLIKPFYRDMCIAKPCIQQVQQQQRTLCLELGSMMPVKQTFCYHASGSCFKATGTRLFRALTGTMAAAVIRERCTRTPCCGTGGSNPAAWRPWLDKSPASRLTGQSYRHREIGSR